MKRVKVMLKIKSEGRRAVVQIHGNMQLEVNV